MWWSLSVTCDRSVVFSRYSIQQNVFPEFNIRLYDNNSESDFFFFPPPKSEFFFSNIGNQNIFLEENHNPPLQVKWSFPKGKFKKSDHIYLAIHSHYALIFRLRCISIARKKSNIYVKNFNTWQLCGFLLPFFKVQFVFS